MKQEVVLSLLIFLSAHTIECISDDWQKQYHDHHQSRTESFYQTHKRITAIGASGATAFISGITCITGNYAVSAQAGLISAGFLGAAHNFKSRYDTLTTAGIAVIDSLLFSLGILLGLFIKHMVSNSTKKSS